MADRMVEKVARALCVGDPDRVTVRGSSETVRSSGGGPPISRPISVMSPAWRHHEIEARASHLAAMSKRQDAAILYRNHKETARFHRATARRQYRNAAKLEAESRDAEGKAA